MNVVVMKDGNCKTCDGCGYVANDADATPWKAWLSLPLQSAGAILAGLVRPVQCPTCKGSGEAMQ